MVSIGVFLKNLTQIWMFHVNIPEARSRELFAAVCCYSSRSPEPRKKTFLLSIIPGWLIGGSLIMVYYNALYNWVVFDPLYNPTNQGFFHCSPGHWDGSSWSTSPFPESRFMAPKGHASVAFFEQPFKSICWKKHMDVSKNRGVKPPQIIHFNRVFHEINHPFWRGFPLFLETPI